jgi:hypothetical protein
LDNVVGIGGWSADDLQIKKQKINSKCNNSILAIYKLAVSEEFYGK